MDQTSQDPITNTALSGVRVVELTQYDAGASCAEFLAWYGADVVKVEPPAGVSGRYATTEKPGVDSYEFILLNANKRSVTCDLESARGKEDLRKLITNADVVIEHMAPGIAKRLGFDYDAIRQINPKIVFAKIKGFASGNPRADYLVDDSVAQAVGGAASQTGFEGGPPLKIGATMAATASALQCAQGILAALYQRRATGRGQKIEVAMQESVINLTRNAYMGQAMRGKPLARAGNGSKSDAVPSNLFACKPGGPNDYIFIHISRAAIKHWNALLKTMGREDLVGDARYSTGPARVAHSEEINAMVSEWCRHHTKNEVMETLNRAGTPAGAIFDMQDLTNDPHLRKRGIIATIQHPVRGEITMPAWPVKMSESQVPLRSAPLLGAHTQEVLAEWAAPRTQDVFGPVKKGPSGKAAPDSRTALSGIRVLDLSHNEAAPACTEALAWLGADVVKVEEPTRGERGRYGNSDKPGADAHYFLFLNANKRSMTCNLKSEAGKELVRKLIGNVDIMVENMGPGTLERLGFDYETVRKINPSIVFVQIKGFAPDGPYGKYLCFDPVAQAAGGSLSITGVDGELPLKPGATLGDAGTGLHCATAILAALCQRQASGIGQRIEIAMREGVINFCRMGFARYLASGKPPARTGDRNIYPCKGGGPNDYCFVAASEADDDQWGRLLKAIGRTDVLADARFVTREARGKHSKEIDALVAPWCLQRTKTEAMDFLQRAGVAAGAVFDTRELEDDPELRKSGMFATIEHPVRGAVVMPGFAVKMSESHVPVRTSPLLGAHTDEVLAEWLGLGKQEIAELRKVALTVS